MKSDVSNLKDWIFTLTYTEAINWSNSNVIITPQCMKSSLHFILRGIRKPRYTTNGYHIDSKLS